MCKKVVRGLEVWFTEDAILKMVLSTYGANHNIILVPVPGDQVSSGFYRHSHRHTDTEREGGGENIKNKIFGLERWLSG